MRNPNLSQAALLFALTLTQLVCGCNKHSGSDCIEPPQNLSLVLPEVEGTVSLNDKPPHFSQSFDRIGIGGALSLKALRPNPFEGGSILRDSSVPGEHLRCQGWLVGHSLVLVSWYTAQGIGFFPFGDVHVDGGGWDPNLFNWIEELEAMWLRLAVVFVAVLACHLELGSIHGPRHWWRSTKSDPNFQRLGRFLLTRTIRRDGVDFIESTLTLLWTVWLLGWLWLNRRQEIQSGNNTNSIRIWVSMLLGCLWTRVRTMMLTAGVLSSWWPSDRPKAAASSWWSPAERLLLGLKLVGSPSRLGALVRRSLFRLGTWKLDSGPDLFGSRMNGGFLYPPSS